MMGTRSGDIDPGVIFHLMREGNLAPQAVEKLLNSKSGMLGLSGISNDQRPVEKAAASDPRARLALDVFAYRIRKYIGAYIAVIGRPHALIFTGGIGERGVMSRADICSGLEHLGIALDAKANENCRGAEMAISVADSPVKIWVVPTNEELMIARDTAALAAGRALEQ